jgi:hypothetical protein
MMMQIDTWWLFPKAQGATRYPIGKKIILKKKENL